MRIFYFLIFEDFLAFGGGMAKICCDILCGKFDLSFSFLMKAHF